MALPARHRGVMVFEKSPNLRQLHEVLDLDIREVGDGDAGTAVKLVVYVKDRWSQSWRIRDRLTIHLQLQIVDPRFARSRKEKPEHQLFCFVHDWQADGVFGPIRSSVHSQPLRSSEGDRGRISIFAEPESDRVTYIFGLDEPAPH